MGFFAFVLSESTDRWFAWTIQPPLTAAFLGANYFAAAFLAYLSAREPIWANARLTYAVSIVFITLTSVATLLHLDKFTFDNANGWLWVIVYFSVPPLLVVLLFAQLRLPGGDPPRRLPLEAWILPVVGLQALVSLSIGVALFVAPSATDFLWPWQLTPLTARAVAAWLLALAAGLISTLWERDWARIRVSTLTYTAIPLFQFLALARYSDTVNWGEFGVWAYLAFLTSILFLGVFGIRRSWRSASETAPVPAPVGSR